MNYSLRAQNLQMRFTHKDFLTQQQAASVMGELFLCSFCQSVYTLKKGFDYSCNLLTLKNMQYYYARQQG